MGGVADHSRIQGSNEVTQAMTTTNHSERILEVLVGGNLSVLTPPERVDYYNRVCDSLGLNPMTQPFAFITLNGKLVLYALKGATDQLRGIHGISISEPHVQQQGDMYIVTVTAVDKTGRTDSDMGVVAVGKLTGENLANAMLKAITKAKRRVALSICGLGMLDETEIEDIPASAKRPPVQMPQPRQVEAKSFTERNGPPFESVNVETGELVDWTGFWERSREIGYSELQVRNFVGMDDETFDAFTEDDLGRLYADLAKAAGKQPSLV